MYLVKSLSRHKGSGRYTMYLPFSPYIHRLLGAKGADTLCFPLVQESGFTRYMGNP